MNFGEKLQELRKQEGLSQENLSNIIGVSRQSVAKWEANISYPEIDKLILLSNLFKVSIDKLIKDLEEGCCLDSAKSTNSSVNRNTSYIKITREDLISFLIRAKHSTYAGKGSEVSASRPCSHDYNYIEENLTYIDTYLGSNNFAGEEALWSNDVPIWSMNYCGRVIKEGFSGDFLKETLLQVSKEYPYRGPLVFSKGDYKYLCFITGEFEWFQGREEILYLDAKVYECVFHGGII